jgi:hypothetical protein
MSILYVANENGDWWTIDTDTTAGQTLFVISKEELERVTDDGDVDALDKLEWFIQEHGTAQDVEVAL